jgi:hypothetical protein
LGGRTPTSDSERDRDALLLGAIAARQVAELGALDGLHDAEFRVFSQFGDDGIINYLVDRLQPDSQVFVEFGVEDYRESNTRFLMMHRNWAGLVMDGSDENIRRLRAWPEFWKFDLQAKAAFIDRENINDLIASSGVSGEIGVLHIDIDGNDFWVWERLDVVDPVIAVVEFNSVFGRDRPIATPYDPVFDRSKAHHSNLYWGASLPALAHLAHSKGYAFVGCNSAGNNAYFVRRNCIGNGVREVSVADGYVLSRYRESRDRAGQLTYVAGDGRLEAIRGMPVVNVVTMSEELL